MTIGELIDALAKYPRDTKVVAAWEGILVDLKPEGIALSDDNVLVIDANED